MAVRIGHASKDENGKGTGGAAGDQTGKEVCIRSWYNGGWGFVARPKDPAAAERMAAACEAACNNPNVGYDKGGRNTLMAEARAVDFDLAKIANVCECDCSALMAVCIAAAGITIPSGNAPTTSTLKKVLQNTGAFGILTDSKYLTGSDYLLRGDILCKPGSHTVMVLDNGAKAVDNRTAAESGTKAPESGTTAQKTGATVTYSVTLPLLKKGSTGDTVRAMQILLIGLGYSCGKCGADGEFGSGTETALKEFQKAMGLEVDGKCGGQTWAALLAVNN